MIERDTKVRDNLPTLEERHKRGFTGVWIPWYLFDLLEQKVLNSRDLLMYCTISSFCRKGICTASNAYLGRCAGIGEEAARKIISKLCSLKLVERSKFDGRRRSLKIVFDEASLIERMRDQLDGKVEPGKILPPYPVKSYQANRENFTTPSKSIRGEEKKEQKIGEPDGSPPEEKTQHRPSQGNATSSGSEKNGSSRKDRKCKLKDSGLFSSNGVKKE